jgi:hypothetical protein
LNDTVKGSCAKEDIYFGKGLGQICAISLRQATGHDEPPPARLLFPSCHFQDGVNRLIHGRTYKAAGIHHHTVRI